VWIRDAAFCVYALLRLGFTSEAAAFMNFLAQHIPPAGDHPSGPLQIMYGTDGRTDLAEEELPHLEGYEGASPVRIGNGAAEQLQLDIYGELIDSVYLYDEWAEPISSDAWEGLCGLVDWICDHWDQPDEGIWETRGGRKKFLYSRLMCWVAVERAIRMANRRGLPADRARWERTRDDIYRRIMKRGWSARRQAFVQHEDDDVLDAAVLMMPLAKFVAPTDPKWLATLDALSGELVSDSLVYRYDPEASGTAGRRPDGVRGDADVRQPPRPLRRADRRRRRSAGQLPPGLHPPGAHQRRREPRSGPGMTPAWSRPVGPPVHRGRGGPAGLSVSGAAACSR
jgi:GH15 family glucan-1,4-alpha-glucosidase